MGAMQKTPDSVKNLSAACLQHGWLREAYSQTAPEDGGEKEKQQG